MNSPQAPAELEAMRQCVRQGRPFGGEKWLKHTIARLGWREPQPRGRPRKRK